MDGGRGLIIPIIPIQTQSHGVTMAMASEHTEPLVLLGEVTLLQHDHQELRVRGHENLVTG